MPNVNRCVNRTPWFSMALLLFSIRLSTTVDKFTVTTLHRIVPTLFIIVYMWLVPSQYVHFSMCNLVLWYHKIGTQIPYTKKNQNQISRYTIYSLNFNWYILINFLVYIPAEKGVLISVFMSFCFFPTSQIFILTSQKSSLFLNKYL